MITGLAQRRAEQEQEQMLANCTALYKAKSQETLRACMTRAADAYRQQAQDLIASWKQLNLAQLALGDRELGWIYFYVPALPGLQRSTASHTRPTLFDGKHFLLVDGESLKAELNSMLAD